MSNPSTGQQNTQTSAPQLDDTTSKRSPSKLSSFNSFTSSLFSNSEKTPRSPSGRKKSNKHKRNHQILLCVCVVIVLVIVSLVIWVIYDLITSGSQSVNQSSKFHVPGVSAPDVSVPTSVPNPVDDISFSGWIEREACDFYANHFGTLLSIGISLS
jgi:hypothetical protein